MYPPYTLPFAKMYINNSENLTHGVNQFPHVSSAETETHNHFCPKSTQPFDLPGFSRQKNNSLDSCFSFQGKFFHFLTINRHRKIEYDLLYPASVFPFLREHLNSLDKGFHKLFLFRFCCGMVDFIKCQ